MDPDPAIALISKLNSIYGLELYVRGLAPSPTRRREVQTPADPSLGRKIYSRICSVTLQGREQLVEIEERFEEAARHICSNWRHKPRAEPSLLPAAATVPRASTDEESFRLQEALLAILEEYIRRNTKQRRTVVTHDTAPRLGDRPLVHRTYDRTGGHPGQHEATDRFQGQGPLDSRGMNSPTTTVHRRGSSETASNLGFNKRPSALLNPDPAASLTTHWVPANKKAKCELDRVPVLQRRTSSALPDSHKRLNNGNRSFEHRGDLASRHPPPNRSFSGAPSADYSTSAVEEKIPSERSTVASPTIESPVFSFVRSAGSDTSQETIPYDSPEAYEDACLPPDEDHAAKCRTVSSNGPPRNPASLVELTSSEGAALNDLLSTVADPRVARTDHAPHVTRDLVRDRDIATSMHADGHLPSRPDTAARHTHYPPDFVDRLPIVSETSSVESRYKSSWREWPTLPHLLA
jgi:hypothetical protein